MASTPDVKKRKRPKSSSDHTLLSVEPPVNALPSSKADFLRLIAVVSLAATVAVACNFIAASLNQPPRPFCDSANSDSDDYISENCEPCPTHGVCYDGKLECAYGYRKHGKLCVEDGDVNKAAKKISKWVEVRVCEAYAQLLCSGSGKCWVSEDELLNSMDKYKMNDNLELDEAIYPAAKHKAKETIRSVLETRKDHQGGEEIKCPELLVNHYKPLNCVIRQWIIKHALLAVPAIALFIGSLLIASKAYRRHCLSVRAEQLYQEVCDILEEKSLVPRSVGGVGEPWVVASWLRDHLLSPKERKDPFLWRKVEELVEEDSRVDQYPQLVKGESKVVWEWQVEGSLGSSGKKKISEGSASAKESMKSSNVHRRMVAEVSKALGIPATILCSISLFQMLDRDVNARLPYTIKS